MTLDKILAISGKPGLYELKAKSRNGVVVESLLDGKRTTVLSARQDISLLSEISVYTLKEEIPLGTVFNKIKEKENGGKTAVGHKENSSSLEEYFFEVVPDYDEDKVYPSHIKKIIQWYNLLQDKDITFEEPQEGKEKEQEEGE